MKTLLPAISSISGELTTGVLKTTPSNLLEASITSEKRMLTIVLVLRRQEQYIITTARPRQRVDEKTNIESNDPEWLPLAIASVLLILDSLVFGVAPSGPWDDSGFTTGVIGMAGISMGYVAWYRYTFKRKGLVPWIDQWEKPEESVRLVFAAAVSTLALAWASGNPLQPYLPEPTGLVLTLVGLLLALQSIYVYLVLGPLRED